MDKKGKVTPLFIIALCAVILTLGIILRAYNPGLFGTQAIPQTSSQVINTGGTGTIVTTNPTISFTAVDSQASGTAVGFSTKMKVGDGQWGSATSGTTTAVPGQQVQFLIYNSTSGYHPAVVPQFTVTPGSFPMTVLMNKNASITESIYTTTGLVIYNGLIGRNQTALENGQSYNLKDEMTGTAQASTQDMLCVIEVTSGVNLSTSPQGVVYGSYPLVSTGTPAWYSPAGVNSRVYLFDVPAINSGTMVTSNIQINTLSTGKLSSESQLIKTCYTKEHYIDPSLGLQFGVADSLNAIQSINFYKYTVQFK